MQAHGARVTGDGRLVVPLFDSDGDLSTLQYISADGGKMFHPGGQSGGRFWMLGAVDNAGALYVVEGFATAATINEATGRPCVAAYSASNIVPVVATLRKEYGPAEKRKNKDGRAAYGEMQTIMMELLRAFRDITGKHIYMSAKLEKTQDEQGRILYGPSMPGAKLSQQIPYLVDECYALRVERDADGSVQRALMTQSDGLWAAKSRGKLATWEAPDLGAIIAKIGGKND